MFRRVPRFAVPLVAALSVATLMVATAAADDEDPPKSKSAPKGGIFEGRWVNNKRKTNGPMRCDLKPSEEGEWSAVFEGTFQGSPFKYEVEFTAKTAAGKTNFKGDKTIEGDIYQWQGSLKGDAFNVKYRSHTGNNGDFTLKRAKGAPKEDSKRKPPKRG